jgi:hypothetical protein
VLQAFSILYIAMLWGYGQGWCVSSHSRQPTHGCHDHRRLSFTSSFCPSQSNLQCRNRALHLKGGSSLLMA